MCTQIMLDKKTIPESIDEQFKGINYKDCIATSKTVKEILTKEKTGPNYFLVGGPYQNYA